MVLSSVWCQCTSSLLTQNNPKYDGVTKDGCHQNKWETKRPNNLIHSPWRVCSCCLLTENRRIIITISANNFRFNHNWSWVCTEISKCGNREQISKWLLISIHVQHNLQVKCSRWLYHYSSWDIASKKKINSRLKVQFSLLIIKTKLIKRKPTSGISTICVYILTIHWDWVSKNDVF